MPIRVVIVDDEKPARDRIRRFLSDHEDFTVVGEATDARGGVSVIDRERPELCFLDVQMPEGDGFELLAGLNHVPRVIFTTAYDQYAVRAFEVNSIDYLLKPFDRKRFNAALARARDAIRSEGGTGTEILEILEEIRSGLSRPGPTVTAPASSGTVPAETAGPQPGRVDLPAGPDDGPGTGRIAGRRGGKIVLLEPAEILWFEAEDTLVFARAPGGRYLVNRTLADLESRLDPEMFFRAHRGYLVNLSHIGEIRPGEEGNYRIVLKDEARSSVPLSRRQSRKLRERFPW
jgi:DNA-binding LytR/AlgR family response regulator